MLSKVNVIRFLKVNTCSRSLWRAAAEDKRMVLVHTHGLFFPMRIYISKIITMNNVNLRTIHIAYNMLILFITNLLLFKAMDII
jgi:hypothetical protein